MRIRTCVGALAVAGCCLIGLNSRADVWLNLKDTKGLQFPSSPTWLPIGAMVQLVWSGVSNYAGESDGAQGPREDLVVAGDYSSYGPYYVVYTRTTPGLGGWSSDLDGGRIYSNSHVGGNNVNTGYFFLYVFQDATPAGGEYYARSPIMAGPYGNPYNTPTPDIARGLDIAPSTAVVLNQYTVQAVPEPGTLCLFGLGLLTIAARKRLFRS